MGYNSSEPTVFSFKKRCLRKFSAEMFGVIILVLAAVLTHTWMQPLGLSFLVYSLIVIGLACVIQPISGCHLNPAVSIGEALDGEVYVRCSISYIAMQAIGAVIAGILLFFVTATVTPEMAAIYKYKLGNGYFPYPPLAIDYSSFASVIHTPILNFILIFIFVFLVTGVVGRHGKNKIIGITVGFTLILEHGIAVLFTGASVNPMINIGIAVQMALHGLVEAIKGNADAAWFFPLRDLWAYIVPAILAALAAGRIGLRLFRNDHHAHTRGERVLHACHAHKDDVQAQIKEDLGLAAEESGCDAECGNECDGCHKNEGGENFVE